MDELISLSNKTLDQLTIERPRYNRSSLTPGIVHIGVGNFHRAHQAWYLHRLMQLGQAQDWAIVGAGVRPYDAKMREKLLAQDCLTTLIELDPDAISAEIIGSMISYLPIEEHNEALVAQMADPKIRIVSLTVTESGYYQDSLTQNANSVHPDLQHDAANPLRPKTAFGAVVAALRQRRDAGVGPFTGLSCDNLQGNGDVLRHTIVSLARLSDPELALWIDKNVTFPNSMVDCIAPATGPKERALGKDFGLNDPCLVTHESFRQWVIEDAFCAGRPSWEKVGATLSDNVHAFEAMKIRILNAGHQVLANVGEILGLETIFECMLQPEISAFFAKIQRSEIAPTVAAVPGKTPGQYVQLIEERFSNPRIIDTTRRVAFDGSARHPGFVLPIVRDQLKSGGAIEGLALAEAFWARMCFGQREDGSLIEANDPLWADLCATAKAAKVRPGVWLEQTQLYGDLSQSERFCKAFSKWLNVIWEQGANAALLAYTKPAHRASNDIASAARRTM